MPVQDGMRAQRLAQWLDRNVYDVILMYYIMSTRTVRLDDESENMLAEVRRATGLSVSAALKQGLATMREAIAQKAAAFPYSIYQTIDLGPGGYAECSARDAKSAIRGVLQRRSRR